MNIKEWAGTILAVGAIAVATITLLTVGVDQQAGFEVAKMLGLYYLGLAVALVVIGAGVSIIKQRYRMYQWNKIEKRVKK